jgi:hypothetical protein
LHTAYLVCQYLRKTNPKQLPSELKESIIAEVFAKMAPNILMEPNLPEESFVLLSTLLCISFEYYRGTIVDFNQTYGH